MGHPLRFGIAVLVILLYRYWDEIKPPFLQTETVIENFDEVIVTDGFITLR